jgi:hypothetical protein
MAEDITLEEKERRFDAALDKLQRTVEAGGDALDETLDDFLEAANYYRSDMRYQELLGSASDDSDPGSVEHWSCVSPKSRPRRKCCDSSCASD